MKDTGRLEAAFILAVKEVELILKGKKSITDKTRLASATIGNYAKIKSVEVHEYALDVAMTKLNGSRPRQLESAVTGGSEIIGEGR